jgi:putative serine protease PepD
MTDQPADPQDAGAGPPARPGDLTWAAPGSRPWHPERTEEPAQPEVRPPFWQTPVGAPAPEAEPAPQFPAAPQLPTPSLHPTTSPTGPTTPIAAAPQFSWDDPDSRSGRPDYSVLPAAPGRSGFSPRRRRSGAAVIAALAATVLITALVGGYAGAWLFNRSHTSTRSVLGADPANLPVPASAPAGGSGGSASAGSGSGAGGPAAPSRAAGSVAAVAARVLPSVVAVRVTGSTGEGTGSGFVIDGKGHILTNNHVVSLAGNGGTIKVVFDDGSQKDATVVGRDSSYDLAVIKADTGSRAPLVLGNSDQVVVGDAVIAIGAPLGLQGTVTTGIVSAKNRPVTAGDAGGTETSFINAVQTDAAINPGNSGGPLVDANGTVIGVNSAIARVTGTAGGTGGNIGVGFAIPSNQARRTATELIDTGKAEHPVIGISLDERYTGEGVRIVDTAVGNDPPVRPGGPADKAGMKAGDVITAIDGRPVTTPSELIVAIRAKAVGDIARLTVRRDGSDRMVAVTLAAGTG